MKAYVNFITPIALGVILFGSCSTKKQVSSNANATASVQPITLTDTTSYVPLKQYYQPHLSYKLPSQYLTVDAVRLTPKDIYELALMDLKDMLEEKTELSFERAVFLSENPYHNGRFSYSAFQNSITTKLLIIQQLIKANDKSDTIEFDRKVNQYGRFNLKDLEYLPEERKELYRQALSNWAIFRYLTDTVLICTLKDSTLSAFSHSPFNYAVSDPFGIKDWRHSQVMSFLVSEKNQGNCFALTALFKILSDRLNANARLCTAPQHIYIQHQDYKGQYYNVELATAGHPGDGIIQTLTYTPTEGIMSGIALRDYTTKQSIGLCIVNLAKSYERKFNTKDDEFLLRCAELALAHDSLNLNALLLKQQVLDSRVTKYAVKNGINSVQKLKQDTGISKTALKLEKHLALLYNLGYREMPLDMQELIMNPLGYDPTKWNRKSQNARPFSSFEPPDPKDAEYWTLTKGMFKEIWEPTAAETYGHYTITTATGKLKTIDTTSQKEGLIDPVAFAYDFGARMYDARIGHFVSVDPHASRYPGISPYNYAYNSPLVFNDPDGKDGRVSITGNTITLETTVHCYGPDAAAFIAANKGYSSSGTVKIDGKTYITKINVTYVLNESLNSAAAGLNNNFSQRLPEASNFAAQGVLAGDNMMYVDKNFKMPSAGVQGMTFQGASSARINNFLAAPNETMNMLGFSDRYGPDEYGMPWPDEGFMKDFAANNPNSDPVSTQTMHPVHLYDVTKFANELSKIVKSSRIPYIGKNIDNLGNNKTHVPENEADVKKKSSAVSGQTTTVK